MAGFNKVLMLGNLTRDPQLSYTPNQTAVVDFGLATNRKWTGPNGNQREETCFVDCRAFGRQEGRLTFDTWTAQDGTKRSKHRITVENFQFLPGGGPSSPGRPTEQDVRTNSDYEQTSVADKPADDDIPF
jgi:single-strand DNA-binding protein